ncbi:hypothetical protein GH714_027362 [Hevea brasiliensis]|uniref:Uncharacterized protein n=1 Tax=Hevea brasiliensis TaxID=3981 RepID=A0A6A6LUE1_HEVBR|nr:hypothetical protein GH714_027362 [Hevea brasiliensis]
MAFLYSFHGGLQFLLILSFGYFLQAQIQYHATAPVPARWTNNNLSLPSPFGSVRIILLNKKPNTKVTRIQGTSLVESIASFACGFYFSRFWYSTTKPTSHEIIQSQPRRRIVRGIRPLTVNGDTQRNYSIKDEHKDMIRDTFERVGSERLSDTLGKAKKAFSKMKKIPKWISQNHWDDLMKHWNTDNFKKISSINSNNRKSSNNGEVIRNIKQKVGDTSTARNEDGSEEQVLNTWIDTIGGAKKGRVYGFGSETSALEELTHVSSVHSNAPTPPTVPPQQVIETPEFEQAANHVVDQWVDDRVDQQMELMQARFCEEVEAAVHAIMSRMFGLFPQPPGNGSSSSSQPPPHF